MAVTIRKVKWMSSNFRPTPMPSTKCPCVKDWETKQIVTAILCVNRCLACEAAHKIILDFNAQTGEVHCAAS